MAVSMTYFEQDAQHLEVLTAEFSGEPVGYVYRGARPGPNVLVVGDGLGAQMVFDRVLNMPALAKLRGSLTMIWIGGRDPKKVLSSRVVPDQDDFDDMMYLPVTGRGSPQGTAQGSSTVMRLCTRLGMIDGRGVSLFKAFDLKTAVLVKQ
ncbi:hypothetical protein [Pseudoprimorskyibacter insulae]|uniref:Uncharacterized protein n=1 Tax=Pseudoprimorskyibacter insulae TaxID=1695997 RepID=A0A2R8B042_9RHOB|nr:hypothetical protein [Pseudoprimorskyibacter insulae]SPF81662.1 hypothetical protein PRI8871_03487 [Pseudoprimorskyibacter insulae]